MCIFHDMLTISCNVMCNYFQDYHAIFLDCFLKSNCRKSFEFCLKKNRKDFCHTQGHLQLRDVRLLFPLNKVQSFVRIFTVVTKFDTKLCLMIPAALAILCYISRAQNCIKINFNLFTS